MVVEERLLAFSLNICEAFDLIQKECVIFVVTKIRFKKMYAATG